MLEDLDAEQRGKVCFCLI